MQSGDLYNVQLLISHFSPLLQVRSLKSTQIQIDEFRSQRLHGRNIFITFQRTSSEMRDLDGQIIRKLQNHVLSDIKTVENKVIVTSEQDAVISACKNEGMLSYC